ncbi:MAG: FAD-dependent oxidoreductase, partial [Marinibacterium sp.]|nr:FAD-dependent oxidoreductase [Marinibacterium sp.]
MTGTVTILGAGVAGLTMAAEFQRRGASVTVIDPAGGVGAQACSWWAGGMLAPECEGVISEPAVVTQGRRAAGWWTDHGAQLRHNGTLVVALGRDQADLTTFVRRAPAARQIDRAALKELEPHLAERFDRALFIDTEAHLDPRGSLVALQERLAEAGVRFVTEGDPTGQVIDCRGLAARDDLDGLRGVKGEMLVVRCPD